MASPIELKQEDQPIDEIVENQEMNLLPENTPRNGDTTFHLPSVQSFRTYFTSYESLELGVCVLLFLSGFLFEFLAVNPHQRPIPYQLLASSGEYVVNQVYDNAFDGDTVSDTGLLLLGVGLPFFIQLVLSYYRSTRSPKNRIHSTICVYLAAVGLTVLLSDAIKVYVGYLRPIFYEVCVPNETYQICTSDEDVQEARKSFPSGHASLSFCGLGLLSFFLEDSFGVQSLRGLQHTAVDSIAMDADRLRSFQRTVAFARVASIFCKAPLLLAGYIAASRIVDNKHFPADVVGGSVIGISISWWIHGIWA